jgi:hypothetical protein
LQFSLQAASPESSGYTLLLIRVDDTFKFLIHDRWVSKSCHPQRNYIFLKMASQTEEAQCVLFHEAKSVINMQIYRRFLHKNGHHDVLLQEDGTPPHFHHFHFPEKWINGTGRCSSPDLISLGVFLLGKVNSTDY